MNELEQCKVYFQESEKRYFRYFLELSRELGAQTTGSEAADSLSLIWDSFPNIQRALENAYASISSGCEDLAIWYLWRDAVHNLFNFCDYRGLWTEMNYLLKIGIQMARIQNDDLAQAIFVFFQARLDSQRSLTKESLLKTDQALGLFEATQAELWKAHLLHYRGTFYRKIDLLRSRENFDAALVIWKRHRLHTNQAATEYEIGRLEQDSGNLTEAEKIYRESLSAFQQAKMPRESATLLFQLGELRADPDLLNSALEIYNSLLDQRGIAQTLHQLGNVWRQRKELAKAKQSYMNSIRIFEHLGMPNSIAAVQRDMTHLDVTEINPTKSDN